MLQLPVTVYCKKYLRFLQIDNKLLIGLLAKKGKIFSPLRRGNKHMFHSSILFIGETLTTQHKSHRICIYMRNEAQCLPRFPFILSAFSVLCRKFLHFNLFIPYFDAFCVFLPFLFLTTRPLMYPKCSASAIAEFHGI